MKFSKQDAAFNTYGELYCFHFASLLVKGSPASLDYRLLRMGFMRKKVLPLINELYGDTRRNQNFLGDLIEAMQHEQQASCPKEASQGIKHLLKVTNDQLIETRLDAPNTPYRRFLSIIHFQDIYIKTLEDEEKRYLLRLQRDNGGVAAQALAIRHHDRRERARIDIYNSQRQTNRAG